MDIQQFISSGVLETYVLGLASSGEKLEVETFADQYPEVKQAITDFEIALEKQALENAVEPPAFLKERVMKALEEEGRKQMPRPLTAIHGDGATQPKVISITAAPKSIRWLRGAIAASIILLLGSAILNFYFYSQYKKYSNEYSNLLAQNGILTAKSDALKANFDMLRDTTMRQIIMKAPNEAVNKNVATVLWNTQSKDVWLLVNNLPATTQASQYQLWALVDGKPVDAGVFDVNENGLIKMKNIPNAQAFAVTLEKRGGSPTPHLEQLQMIGKV